MEHLADQMFFNCLFYGAIIVAKLFTNAQHDPQLHSTIHKCTARSTNVYDPQMCTMQACKEWTYVHKIWFLNDSSKTLYWYNITNKNTDINSIWGTLNNPQLTVYIFYVWNLTWYGALESQLEYYHPIKYSMSE